VLEGSARFLVWWRSIGAGRSLWLVARVEIQADIGLHLCLTDEGLALSACAVWPGGRPPRLPSFPNLLSPRFGGGTAGDDRDRRAQYELSCGSAVSNLVYRRAPPRASTGPDCRCGGGVRAEPAGRLASLRSKHPFAFVGASVPCLPWLKPPSSVRAAANTSAAQEGGTEPTRASPGIYDFKRFRDIRDTFLAFWSVA